jgi:hypothetical protein
MRHFPMLPMIVCAVALAGCGSDAANEASPKGDEVAASSTRPTAAADPCSFISREDVTAITGEAVVGTKAEGDTCRYETADAMASSVQVDIKQSGGKEEMDVARSAAGALGSMGADLKESGGAAGDTGTLLAESGAAPKIGDQAFFGPNQQLSVLKGDIYFAVSPPQMRSRMSGGNPLLPVDKKREMAAAIAQKIASKL